MYCMRCQLDIIDCTCPDIEERLEALSRTSGWLLKRCDVCGEFTSRCLCGASAIGKLGAKCKQCSRPFVNSDAHDFYQFCSDRCQRRWWDLLEIAATLVRNSLDAASSLCA